MQNFFSNNRIKMVLVLLFTFLAVRAVAPNLFIANSPKINPVFITEIINKPKEIAAMPGRFLSSLSNFRLFNFDYSDEGAASTTVARKRVSPAFREPIAKVSVNPKVIAEVKFKTPPANLVFKYVSKGVSAAEDPQTGEKYIKVEAGTKYRVVGEIEINGKTYPKIEFVE